MNYFRSSNAMDAIKSSYQNYDNSIAHSLQYKVIGGVFDFRFFIGGKSPEDTQVMFNRYVGESLIPPFWSLGFHQCRWGYKNVGEL